MSEQVLTVRDSTTLARFLLGAAGAAGADPGRLARESRLPGWSLATDGTMIPSRHALRLWELIEHAIDVPHVPLAIAGRYQPGSLDLWDYLFATAATLRDGMGIARDFLHLVTTNGRIGVSADTDRETSYSYQHVEAAGRGSELARQFAIAALCLRARAATGLPVVPARVAFAQAAPRSYREFGEVFGTNKIDFGAPVTTITFSASDLDLPLRGADHRLAGILHRYAGSLPTPPAVTWREHVQQQLTELIEAGHPSIQALARRLAVSTRTLQRQFAEQGTTWRAELDLARYRRALHARRAGVSDLGRLARQLGYADPGSARRALSRWDDGAEPPQLQPPPAELAGPAGSWRVLAWPDGPGGW